MFELNVWVTEFREQLAAFISVLITLFIFHKFVSPRVNFSEFIRSENLPDKDRSRYSIKLAKRGPIDLVDVRITCRLYIKDIFSTESKMWTTFPIPVTYSESPILTRDERVIYLSLHKSSIVEGRNGSQIRKKILERYKISDVTFEFIFMLFPKSYLKVHLLGNDRFTGVLKVYASDHYGLWALRQGKWRADSIELIRSNE